MVEIIISVGIIAILLSTGFLILTKWINNSRDSKKISDFRIIENAFEIYSVRKGEINYPIPDNSVLVEDLNGGKLWYQGILGENVVSNFNSLQKLPLDPDGKEYPYSVSYDKKYYQLFSIIENMKIGSLNKVYANDFSNKIFVIGNYRGYIVAGTGGTYNFIATPSMFVDLSLINNTESIYKTTFENEILLPNGSKDQKAQVLVYDITNFVLSGEIQVIDQIKLDLQIDNVETIVNHINYSLGKNGDNEIKITYNNCEGETYTGYNITNINHGESLIFTREIIENYGVYNFSLNASCYNGSISYGEEIGPEFVNCIEGYSDINGVCVDQQLEILLGNGADGDRTITSTNVVVNKYTTLSTNVSANATNVISVANGSLFKVGDEILIHQSLNSSNGGTYQFKRITGISGNQLTLSSKISKTFYSGAQVVRVPNYQNLTIESGASVISNTWNGSTGGIIAFKVSGNFVNKGTISASARGYRGASQRNGPASCCGTFYSGYRGESRAGGKDSVSKSANYNGGGSGHSGYSGSGNANGAGGGGHGTSGGTGPTYYSNTGGAGGGSIGNQALSTIYFGGGGGSGGVHDTPGYSGAGGAGGGFIFISALDFNSTGGIVSNGGNASGTSGSIKGGSGGGAGGAIWLIGNTMKINNVTANGGNYSNGSAGGSNRGGAGGVGRIRIDRYVGSYTVTGTVSPGPYQGNFTLPSGMN